MVQKITKIYFIQTLDKDIQIWIKNNNKILYPIIPRKKVLVTCPGWMVPGHQAMVGSRIPPSNVVSFPHRNGPLLPPVWETWKQFK